LKQLREKFQNSPLLVRVLPFAIFLLLTSGQGKFFTDSEYWLYLFKTLVGIFLIWLMRPAVLEMRWAVSWEAVVVGAGVFVAWVTLDPYYRKLGASASAWNPPAHFGAHTPLALLFLITRTLGSTFVVPPLEETFYRSFVYRYIAKADFLAVPFKQFAWTPFLVTVAMFGFSHHEWLAGLLCAAAYQWLVLRKNRLGDAITAHAITNFLLALWVIFKPAWNFW
jgi:CAAX prenyl protease-like protein